MPIFSHEIESEILQSTREIRVYLPDGWTEGDEPLPVLYMQDGQHLFAGGCDGPCWGVDESVDELFDSGLVDPPLIVGIVNSEWRDDEYTPSFDAEEGAGGEADRYLDFLLEEVKPLVDATYPVKPFREDTAIGGSSLGGLLALYGVLSRPELFGMAAIFSPSIWWDERRILELAEAWDGDPDEHRLWVDMGWLEQDEEEAEAGEPHPVEETDALVEILADKGFEEGQNLLYHVDPEGAHDEDSWGKRFADALLFLFGSTPDARGR